jgi:hypothetical protein
MFSQIIQYPYHMTFYNAGKGDMAVMVKNSVSNPRHQTVATPNVPPTVMPHMHREIK